MSSDRKMTLRLENTTASEIWLTKAQHAALLAIAAADVLDPKNVRAKMSAKTSTQNPGNITVHARTVTQLQKHGLVALDFHAYLRGIYVIPTPLGVRVIDSTPGLREQVHAMAAEWKRQESKGLQSVEVVK